MTRTSEKTAAAVLLVVAASGCGPRDSRPDVLLITIDTLRADRLGCYGDSEARTPVLDSLAAAGARFTRASSNVPVTLPSHATILTGRYPVAHGVRDNGTFSLRSEEETLAEAFRGAGWRTAAFVGAYVLSRPFGLAQGFETFDDRFRGAGAVEPPPAASARGAEPVERRAGAVTDAALAWYRTLSPGDRAFAWVHYFDPHADYAPPEPFLSSSLDRYRGEIAYTDAEIGRLLRGVEELGRRAGTLVVVVSDHGEAFGEHGETQHGLFVYESTIRVPFLLAWPGQVPARTVVEHEVSLADVAPTLAALAGVRLGAPVQGRDLSAAVRVGAAPEPGDGILIENLLPRLEFGWSELYALRSGGWKYIDAPRPELYDLREDEAEAHDRARERPEQVSTARETTRRTVERLDTRSGARAPNPADSEALERLRSLGYVAATAPSESRDAASGDLPDPKDRVHEYLDIKRATSLAAMGRYGEAIALMERIVAANPGNLWMRLEMGRAWQFAGDAARAEAVFREVLRLHPGSCEAEYRLGEIDLVVRKNLPGAERRFRAAIACDPNRVDALERLSAVVHAGGDESEARGLLERAVDLAPGVSALRVRLGELLDDAGDLARAEHEFLEALEIDPAAPGAAAGLGTIALKRRDLDRAEKWLREAIAADSEDAVSLANLGTIELHRGDRVAGVSHLERALELDPSLEQARQALERVR